MKNLNKDNLETTFLKQPKIAVIGLSGKSVFMDVDHFNQIGETVVADNIFIEAGGKGYNQAVACKRLGADVCFYTILGTDDDGDYCLEELNKEGIKTFAVRKNGKTAYANILTDKNGENQVTVYPGVTNELENIDLKMFYETMIDCDIILIQLEIPLCITKEIIKIAKNNNVLVVLNPAPAIKYIKEFDDVYLLTPNMYEANILFDLTNNNINEIIDLKHNNIVITNGGKGCIIISNEIIEIPALSVKAIDTTGAGDVFSAALCVFLAKTKDITKACEFAIIAAGISTERKYAVKAIPTLKEVLERMKK